MKKAIFIIMLSLWISLVYVLTTGSAGHYGKKVEDIPDDSLACSFCHSRKVRPGVNIHFTSGHGKDLDLIKDAGIKFIRMDFIWEEIEKTKGIYDWKDYDELTRDLEERGINAVYILDYSNHLYEDSVTFRDPITGEEGTDVASPSKPESVEAYATWAAAAAERYKGKNIVWELWNEPNISFWRPGPDINKYVELALSACEAIRSKDKDALIIGPATSRIPFDFIEPFLKSGILKYINGVSVHPYREYSMGPETAASEYEKLRELIELYTPEGKRPVPVISSEWGYASATEGLPLERQAAFAVRMQLSNCMNGIPFSIWYDWKNDGESPTNFEHNCGTVDYNLNPKPAYIALKTMNWQLDGYTFERMIDTCNPGDFILLFINYRKENKLVAWTTAVPHSITLKIKNDITGAVSGLGTPVEVNKTREGLSVELGELPQYVSLKGKVH